MIRTGQAGAQEVAAGREVEIDLVSGNRITGRILAVSPDSLLLDSGTGSAGVTVAVAQIAQVVTLTPRPSP